MTDANTVELRKGEDGQDWTYEFEVIEWPTAPAGGGGTYSPVIERYYRTLMAGGGMQ